MVRHKLSSHDRAKITEHRFPMWEREAREFGTVNVEVSLDDTQLKLFRELLKTHGFSIAYMVQKCVDLQLPKLMKALSKFEEIMKEEPHESNLVGEVSTDARS